ncbi:hypothetical protein BDV97DRAFT_346838 [Delphinella strobiligena]|nr:hypothetical protein BDV97DRAFT_346838 [Delphinella strobiligena]
MYLVARYTSMLAQTMRAPSRDNAARAQADRSRGAAAVLLNSSFGNGNKEPSCLGEEFEMVDLSGGSRASEDMDGARTDCTNMDDGDAAVCVDTGMRVSGCLCPDCTLPDDSLGVEKGRPARVLFCSSPWVSSVYFWSYLFGSVLQDTSRVGW